MKHKTIKDLNSTAWYRLLKVVYGFVFGLLALIIIMMIYGMSMPAVMHVDNDKTTIVCNYGNKDTYTATEAGIHFTVSDFEDDYFRNSIRATMKDVCQSTEEETKQHFDDIFAGKETIPVFDVTPAYRTSGGIFSVLRGALLTIIIIGLIFEAIKRAFYYVVLGTIRPINKQ